MAELLGMGVTHAPMFQFPDKNMADILRRFMKSPRLPDHLKDVSHWPEPMQLEWGDDEGLTSARRHRELVVNSFRRLRGMPSIQISSLFGETINMKTLRKTLCHPFVCTSSTS